MRQRALLAAVALGLQILVPCAGQAQSAKTPAAKAPAAAPAVDPEAFAAIEKMTAYLQTLTAFKLTSNTSLDLVTLDGQRIQVDGVATYEVQRPSGFRIEVDTAMKKRTFYYNGKTFTMNAPELGFYATVSAPPTIGQTLDVLWDKYQIDLPLDDLFRWVDRDTPRRGQLTSGFLVGPALVDGVTTQQYAFRQGEVDWQIWIQKDGPPLPRKIMIIDRTDPADPAYIARLTWDTSVTPDPSLFTFHPSGDAKAIRLTSAAK